MTNPVTKLLQELTLDTLMQYAHVLVSGNGQYSTESPEYVGFIETTGLSDDDAKILGNIYSFLALKVPTGNPLVNLFCFGWQTPVCDADSMQVQAELFPRLTDDEMMIIQNARNQRNDYEVILMQLRTIDRVAHVAIGELLAPFIDREDLHSIDGDKLAFDTGNPPGPACTILRNCVREIHEVVTRLQLLPDEEFDEEFYISILGVTCSPDELSVDAGQFVVHLIPPVEPQIDNVIPISKELH